VKVRSFHARDASAAVPAGVFERRLLRILTRARLPKPVAQHRIRLRGRTVAVDFAYPDAKLAIEADGYRWHSGKTRWEHDRARRNELTLLGRRVVHVTWTDLTDTPDAVVDSIRKALSEAT
jgi:very-short-patch-repair endonuclease